MSIGPNERPQQKRGNKMTTTKYKGYTIKNVGISQYIYRPNNPIVDRFSVSDGYAQSLAAAKRWINADIATNGGMK